MLGPVACTGSGDVVVEEEPFPRDALVIAVPSEARNLIRALAQSHADSAVVSNLSLPLVEPDFDCRISYRPGLATSWDWNEDGTVLRMELRDDIRWSDGQLVTADDVAFAAELIADPAVASPRLSNLQHMVPGKRPLVVDDTHIEWHFTHAYDRDLQLSHVEGVDALPRHVLAGADRATLRGNPFNQEPVVNGWWKVAEWSPGERVVLEPNEAWSGPPDERPELRQVVYRVLPDYSTRLVGLETGDVDLVQSLQVDDIDRLAQEHPEIRLIRRGWRTVEFIGYNELDPADYQVHDAAALARTEQEKARIEALTGIDDTERAGLMEAAGKLRLVDPSTVAPHRLFSDRRVRRALTKAIDTDKLIADMLTSRVTGEAYGRPAVSTFSPELCDVINEDVARLPLDPAAARKELAAAGWEDHDGDGVIDKEGHPFRFSLMINTGNPRREQTAVIVQANLLALGIQVDVERLDFGAMSERQRNKDFDAAVGGLAAGLFPDPAPVWHSGPEHELNFVSYANPAADALMDRGIVQTDPDVARQTWKELQQVIYDDQPVTFLFWRDEVVGLHERFEDAEVDVLTPWGSLNRWWVPADKVRYPHTR